MTAEPEPALLAPLAEPDALLPAVQPPTWSSPRLRICLVTDSFVPSGVGEHLLTLAGGLRAQHDIVVAARPQAGLLERARAVGVAAQPIDPDDAAGLEQWFGCGHFSHVHVHAGIGWEGHGLSRAAHRAGVPHVLRTEHLPYLLTDTGQRVEYRETLRLVERIICVSDVSTETFRSVALRPDQVVTILNGVSEPAPRLRREAVRTRLGVGAAPVVLMVARFSEQKGHAVLLDAWPTVLDRTPGAVLLLVGDGHLLMSVARQVGQRGCAASIRLLGQRHDVADLMGAADVLVLPSAFEGLPLVVLEAMASGLPVVASDAPGNAEAVDHGTTGWLTPVGDPVALADTLSEALNDPVLRAAAARASRRRFAERFHARRMIEQTADLYASLSAADHAVTTIQ